MVKAADALVEAGYDVSFVSTRTTDWAARVDPHLHRSRRWSWRVVDLTRDSAPWRWWATGARHRLARAAARTMGEASLPWRIAAAAFSRAAPEIARAMAASGADIFYAGTSGALSAAHDAAAATGRPFGVDLEDWHTGEREDEGAALHHRLAARIESRVLARAAFVTASSEGIAAACRRKYNVDPAVVHNVWTLPSAPPDMPMRSGPLRFYWFSQTIGPGRGLAETVKAIGAANIDAALTLRGRPIARFVAELGWLASRVAPRLTLDVQPPVPPDDIPASAVPFDIGVSAELPAVENHRLALSNKLFMYMTTGLAILASTVDAQRSVLASFGEHVAWLDPVRPEASAPILRRWALDRTALHEARQAAWGAARTRWHWEHPLERGALLAQVAAVTGRESPCASS
jgi:hypothetical protein